VNCAAIPETLVESELFGYLTGAFSGANDDRQGLIQSANKGTLFLDEIGDLPLASQGALLRVLQEHEVLPVGGTRPVPIDVRFISATHRDLNAMVERGTFRKDLLARIGQHRATLPPLRDRREDLGLLIGNILGSLEASLKAILLSETARALLLHTWPLNIRELEQGLKSALALAEGLPIDLEHLPTDISGSGMPAAEDRRARDDKLRAVLQELLEKHAGNVAAVARDLGKDRRQITRWLARFAIQPTVYRS